MFEVESGAPSWSNVRLLTEQLLLLRTKHLEQLLSVALEALHVELYAGGATREDCRWTTRGRFFRRRPRAKMWTAARKTREQLEQNVYF